MVSAAMLGHRKVLDTIHDRIIFRQSVAAIDKLEESPELLNISEPLSVCLEFVQSGVADLRGYKSNWSVHNCLKGEESTIKSEKEETYPKTLL
jgi:hypothetical protein